MHARIGFQVILTLLLAICHAAVPAQSQPAAKPKVNYIPIAEAKKAAEGDMVFIQGQVLSVAPPRPDSKQPYSIYVADQSDSVRVVIFQDTWSKLPDPSFIEKGSKVDVYGESGIFKGTRQIVVVKPTHIRRTPGTSTNTAMSGNKRAGNEVATISIGGINAWSIGNKVRVRGTVTKYELPENSRMPHRLQLKDATGEVEVIYWDKVAEQVAESNKPAENMPLQVVGEVVEYRGKFQVRVDEASGITRQFGAAAEPAAQESMARPRKQAEAAF